MLKELKQFLTVDFPEFSRTLRRLAQAMEEQNRIAKGEIPIKR